MTTSQQFKSTIVSTQKMKKITMAMRLVAASKLGHAQKRMAKSKPYAEKMYEVIGHVACSHSEYRHPFLLERDSVKNIGLIVIGSDRGLCGGLNVNLFRHCLKSIKSWEGEGK